MKRKGRGLFSSQHKFSYLVIIAFVTAVFAWKINLADTSAFSSEASTTLRLDNQIKDAVLEVTSSTGPSLRTHSKLSSQQAALTLLQKQADNEETSHTDIQVCSRLREKYSDVIVFLRTPAVKECANLQLSLEDCLVHQPTSGTEKSSLTFGSFFLRCGIPVSFVDQSSDQSISCKGSDDHMTHLAGLNFGSTSLAFIVGSLCDLRLAIYEKVNPLSTVYLGTNLKQDALNLKGGIDQFRDFLKERDVILMGMSFFHARFLQEYMNHAADVMYNPVSEYSHPLPNSEPVLKEKFVYVSAPGKALVHACRVMLALQEVNPSVYLVVYRPAYSAEASIPAECLALTKNKTVIIKEPQGYETLSTEVATSFAAVFPGGYEETFGNAHFECNCVGTPVLAEATGALPEVLMHPELQLLRKSSTTREYVTRILHWWEFGRPLISCHTDKKLAQVMKPLLQKLLS